MKKLITLVLLLTGFGALSAQNVPELLYYKFDGTGTSVPNMASSPPVGTLTGTITGGMSQGGTGLCGGALIGSGASSTTDKMNTGWNTTLGNTPWTIMFWTNNIPSSATLFYQFGDAGATSFRCFTNGVAGAGNWMLRGPITDVLCTGCAPINTPSMAAFVYDPVLGNIKSYHNGVLNTTVAQGVLNINGTGFTVGGYAANTGLALGQLMDEFRFYNRAVSASEVLLVYNQCLPLGSAPNDAGISEYNAPTSFCPDTLAIQVTVKNYGKAVLDSCTVNWTFNGAPRPSFTFVGPLDTVGGTGLNTALVTLGSEYFAASTPYTIRAWTSLPNNVPDTVNYNDTIVRTVQASLQGTYTLGNPGADYPSFTAAAADLIAYGVCGPVLFNVYDTTYAERIDLTAITGASATNTITFRAVSGTPTMQIGGTVATDNYVVRMSGADYVAFDGITLSNPGTLAMNQVVVFMGGSDNNTFMNCHLKGLINGTSTSTNTAVIFSSTGLDNNNLFIDNIIEGGSYGAYWYGASTTSLEGGNEFRGNTFLNNYYYGARLYYQDNLQFVQNTFNSNSPYTGTAYGFFFGYCDNALRITHNQVMAQNRVPLYGIYVNLCDGAPGNEGLIANNFIHVGVGVNATFYGIYNATCTYQRFNNNNINLDDIGTASRAFYVTGGSNNELVNNCIKSNLGYAVYFATTTAVSVSNFNNFKTNGANLGWFSANRVDLTAWQTASLMDANSWSVNPMYYSPDNLHVCSDSLNGRGTPLAWITDDFDGELRHLVTPDIGADEFSALAPGFLGADTTICSNDSVMYTAGSPADVVTWSHGPTTNSVWLSTPGIYTVSVTNPCGTRMDTVEIIASALVYSAFVGADTTAGCEGDTVAVYSNSVYDTYSWSSGDSTQTISVTASGTYVLDVTDACGAGTDSVTIMINPAPVVNAGLDQSVCIGDSVTLSGSGALTYAWDLGIVDGQPFVATATQTYTVTGTDANGCTGSDQVLVTATTVDTTLTSAAGTLSVPTGGGNTYQWVDCNNGNQPIPGATSNTYTPTVNGSYACVITNGGCTKTTRCENVIVIAVESPLGNFRFTVYPNPASNVVTLAADHVDAMQLRLKLISAMGQEVHLSALELQAGPMRQQIDVSQIAAGIYFLQLEIDGQKFAAKLVIARN